MIRTVILSLCFFICYTYHFKKIKDETGDADSYIFGVFSTIICIIILVIIMINSILLYLNIDIEKDSISEIQKIYDINSDFKNLELSLDYTDNFYLVSVVVSSQSKSFNEEELRYSLGEYQKNKKEDSKLKSINYTYFQEQSGFDKYGQSILDKECTIEFKTKTIDKINFDNISDKDLLEHGYYDRIDDDCFKLEGES